eukprot:5444318-Amphidinium_carterae.1
MPCNPVVRASESKNSSSSDVASSLTHPALRFALQCTGCWPFAVAWVDGGIEWHLLLQLLEANAGEPNARSEIISRE